MNTHRRVWSVVIGIMVASHSCSFERLADKYTWPVVKPAVNPDEETLCMIMIRSKKFSAEDLKLIVELGSWLGASARFMLDHVPHARLIAIDHWEGSSEMQENPRYKWKLANLYETFLVTCWAYKRSFTTHEDNNVGRIARNRASRLGSRSCIYRCVA